MPSAAVEAAVRRWAAPAAFLLVVTIAVLLVRAGLEGSRSSARRSSNPSPPPASSTTTAQPRTVPRPPARYYVIKSGDTLDGVALSEHTTVEKLRALNPAVDPTALHVGQRIRVS